MFVAGDGPTGVLVLAGSSGRVEQERCRVLAGQGATAASYRWFGETVDRVPLESFDEPLALLHERCERLVVLGHLAGRRGRAAPRVAAPRDRRGRGRLAEHVVWAALSQERPQRSSWTRGGEPLRSSRTTTTGSRTPIRRSSSGMYEQSLETYADRVPAARIPVERIAGEVVLVAGGDDRVWPSVDFAEQIVARRSAAGLATDLVRHPRAGHRVLLPASSPAAGLAPGARRDPRRTPSWAGWPGRPWRSCSPDADPSILAPSPRDTR